MRYKLKIQPIWAGLSLLMGICMAFIGCDEDETTTLSSVAKLTAFSLVEDDSIPELGDIVFSIVQGTDTGLVYTADSIAFGVDISHVVPKFTFEETPGSAILSTPDTTIALSGSDTIDLGQQPMYLTVVSADGSTTKVYRIAPTQHSIDPDLWVWTQLASGIWGEDDCLHRALWLNEQFVVLTNNGFSNHLYTSSNAQNWTDQGEPTLLPSNCHVRQIISDSTQLYYADGQKVYTSSDAKNWQLHDLSNADYEIQTMLLYWNDKVWALVKKNKQQYLAQWVNNQIILTDLQPDGEFPVSDFATLCFISASQRPRAMIMGGFSESGKSLNTRWNIEYSPTIASHNGYRMTEYSIDRPKFTTLTGVETVWYGQKMYLFGGVDADMQFFGRDILYSTDEGLNWTITDTTKNNLPVEYQARQKMSAIVKDSYIYLFGGNDTQQAYGDVWRGRLNEIDFVIKN